MNTIDTLTRKLSELPGIGPRQARRIVFYLVSKRSDWITDLIRSIQALQQSVHLCTQCNRHFEASGNTHVCDICISADKSQLMLVAKETDLENVKKLGVYNGRYFILGGLLPITPKQRSRALDTELLYQEVERAIKKDKLVEIILAFPVNAEGDHTADYIASELDSRFSIKITRLGRGLSTGSDLEYSDDATMKFALQNRSE